MLLFFVLVITATVIVVKFKHKNRGGGATKNSFSGSQISDHSKQNKSQESVPEQLGASFYLPYIDIYDPVSSGFKIFKSFPEGCYKEIQEERKSKESDFQYSDVNDIYDSIAKDTGISSALKGKFSMGVTLNMKTKLLSSGSVDVAGVSIGAATHVKRFFLDQDCFKNASFNDDFIKALNSLPVIIDKPWSRKSWQDYDILLTKFGSHAIVQVSLGAEVRQWTFAKSSFQYTVQQLMTKACSELNGLNLRYKACLRKTREDYEKTKHIVTSNYLEVRGGKDETRNKFRKSKTRQLLEQILNEGENFTSPVGYKYKPVWDILMKMFVNDQRRYTIALNLKQYYYGFRDFGCTLQKSGERKLRSFEYRVHRVGMPIFQCVLINKGCHSDSDCHRGGGGFVTYCHGSSCYDYQPPSFGGKATQVVMRWSEEGHYDEGINNSCYYESPFKAYCHSNYFRSKSIWDGASIL